MLQALTTKHGRLHSVMVESAFDYLFGLITKGELKRKFVTLGLDKELVNDLCNSGYVARNCKLFVYAKSKGLSVKYKDYNLTKRDALLLTKLAKRYNIQGCEPWSLQKLESNELALAKMLKTYIGKFVTKKMSFLIKSYGVSRHDIETDLLCHGLTVLHKKYPYFETSLHAVNTVKSGIHNKGIDIINNYTRARNQRLIRNSDGTFEQVNVDCSVLHDLEAPQAFELRYKDERDSLSKLQLQMNKKGALFISLARGEYNESFSEYLGLNNAELAESEKYDRYLKKVKTFLNVDNESVARFLSTLREHLQ